jgi:diguanylate cyclase (GGDEF)-like protein
MSHFPEQPSGDSVDDLADKLTGLDLDLRMVLALAGDRDLNAREELIVEKLRAERGENLFSDMLYALTHKAFPSRQAKIVWEEIDAHRQKLKQQLSRDPGITVAAHDYLSNRSGLLKNVTLIEDAKLSSLADVATHDGLTGLMDKATFTRRAKEELERQHRYGGFLSLLLLDIDHFKKLNDTFGHADGDIVLQQVAEIVRAQARTTDITGRIGGEEFGVLLIGVNQGEGLIFAERLRQSIENRFKNTPYKLTISAGLAESPQEDHLSADAFFRLADAELYRAKDAGRNRVCTMTSPTST